MIYLAWFILLVNGAGVIFSNFNGPAATILGYAAIIVPPALAFTVVVNHRRQDK